MNYLLTEWLIAVSAVQIIQYSLINDDGKIKNIIWIKATN